MLANINKTTIYACCRLERRWSMVDGRNLVRFIADTGIGRMYSGKLVLTQVLENVPQHSFRRCVQRYQGNRYVKRFTCQDQFGAMAFAQLSYRESLRDIEACLAAQQSKLYHMGIQGPVARSTLADANEADRGQTKADIGEGGYRRQTTILSAKPMNRPTYALRRSVGLSVCQVS